MRLADLQRAFQARVLEGRPSLEGAEIDAEFAGRTQPDFHSRIDVYVQGYRSRLVEALGNTYSTLKRLMGDEEFEACMRRFIDVVPSHHYSVRYYGESLAGFLESEDSGARAVVLADIARWEWLLAEVFDAADDDAAAAQELAGVLAESWPLLSFKFRATLRRTSIGSNALPWWRALQGLAATPATYERTPPTEWLAWRRELSPMFRSLSELEATVLDAARDGATFGELCELIAGDVGEDEAPARAASMLKGWFADELIARVIAPPV